MVSTMMPPMVISVPAERLPAERLATQDDPHQGAKERRSESNRPDPAKGSAFDGSVKAYHSQRPGAHPTSDDHHEQRFRACLRKRFSLGEVVVSWVSPIV